MNSFTVFVYDLKDLKQKKSLIDEFNVEADSKTSASDIAHGIVDNNVEKSIPPYNNTKLGRLEVETKSL